MRRVLPREECGVSGGIPVGLRDLGAGEEK